MRKTVPIGHTQAPFWDIIRSEYAAKKIDQKEGGLGKAIYEHTYGVLTSMADGLGQL